MATGPSPPSTAPEPAARYPRSLPRWVRSLHTRAVVVVLLLVAAPLVLSGYLIQMQVQSAMSQSLVRDTLVLTAGAAQAVASDLAAADNAGVADAVEHLLADRRIAFVVVTDPQGRVLSYRLNNEQAWYEYTSGADPRHPRRDDAMGAVAGDFASLIERRGGPMLAVRRAPVTLDAIPESERPAYAAAGDGVIGYIELGMMHPERERLVTQVRRGTITISAAVCLLCVPVVIGWVSHWTAPLRRLAQAAVALGRGHEPEPLPEHRRDEIGLLGGAFNAMAASLLHARRSLVLANRNLERKVADRTKQLEHANADLERMLEQINRANARLQQEMEEKDQFISAVTHDLGAPLRNIDGLTRLLIAKHAEQMEEEALAKLERIAANVKQESELLDDLLEISRIKSRRGRLTEVDLADVLASVVASLAYDIERARVRIVIDRPMPRIRAERNRFRQVFQNLIDNAIKYMPADAADRRVHVGYTGEDDRLVFYVMDTGRGVAPSDHQRIFQIFRRARYSGTTAVEGKGVGLAAVKAIVECYGGRIWVESTPPAGARFCFTVDPSFVVKAAAATG